MTGLLVGADVGGTATRVAVADADGTVLGVAEEAAGNPNAVGLQSSAERIRRAMTAALRQAQETSALRQAQGTSALRQAQGTSVAIGMGGFETARAAGAEFARACIADGVAARPRIVADLATAYASASSAPHGLVIIAGTGAGAAEIDRAEVIARRDAWGWLLGDQGSGFWIGREAVRWALTQAERAEAPSALSTAVQDQLGAYDLAGLLRACYRSAPYADEPVRLADLSRAVTDLVDVDPAAARIADRAADILAERVLDLLDHAAEESGTRADRPALPIVTGGSVLQSVDRIRRRFTDRVAHATDAPILGAESGLAGALWISAATTADGHPVAAEERPGEWLHDRLAATIERHRS